MKICKNIKKSKPQCNMVSIFSLAKFIPSTVCLESYSVTFCLAVHQATGYSRYCQEWEIDQLLQFCRCNFIFLIFAWFFKAKDSTNICPSQKDQLCFKMEGRRSRPSNLLYIYPFQEGQILVEYFALKNQAKI